MERAMQRASYVWGPLTGFGLAVALVAAVIDQASKYYLLHVYDLPSRGQVAIAPFLDFVFVRNYGISYGLFQQEGVIGQWVLLGIKVAAVALLWVWLARAGNRLTALALGLIVGGALGNAIDRLINGWVTDFVLFYAASGTASGAWRFNWYVFNLADVAIVAGVVGLLYESVIRDRGGSQPPQKAP
jgi:signal peptidase II